MLWSDDIFPSVAYEINNYSDLYTKETISEKYANKFENVDEAKVNEILENLIIDGFIEDNVKAVVGTVGWNRE